MNDDFKRGYDACKQDMMDWLYSRMSYRKGVDDGVQKEHKRILELAKTVSSLEELILLLDK